MGATGLLLVYSAGPSILRVLAEDPKITAPILLHVSHLLALLPTMNFPVLAKSCRLCGADMMLTPSIWSSIPVASTQECLRTSQTLHAPFYHIKPIFPMPGAGIYPGVVPPMLEENGPDMIFMAGGGMLATRWATPPARWRSAKLSMRPWPACRSTSRRRTSRSCWLRCRPGACASGR